MSLKTGELQLVLFCFNQVFNFLLPFVTWLCVSFHSIGLLFRLLNSNFILALLLLNEFDSILSLSQLLFCCLESLLQLLLMISRVCGLELSYSFFRRSDLFTLSLQIYLLLTLLVVQLLNFVSIRVFFKLQSFKFGQHVLFVLFELCQLLLVVFDIQLVLHLLLIVLLNLLLDLFFEFILLTCSYFLLLLTLN